MRVFAYGSNLCVERLRARTPSAAVVAVGTVAGHALRWHKRCPDGSGKCDAFATGVEADTVWGVVYEVTAADKLVLDGFEGLGHDYFEKLLSVRGRDGNRWEAIAYVANPLLFDPAARPFHWYKGFVTTGARQHRFPAAYVDALESVEAWDDPNRERHERETATLAAALEAVRR